MLAPALQLNTSIRTLDLSFYDDDEESMIFFLKGLPGLKSLEHLSAPFEPDLAAKWLEAVQENGSLRHLRLHTRQRLTKEEVRKVTEIILMVVFCFFPCFTCSGGRSGLTVEYIPDLIDPTSLAGHPNHIGMAQGLIASLMDENCLMHSNDEDADDKRGSVIPYLLQRIKRRNSSTSTSTASTRQDRDLFRHIRNTFSKHLCLLGISSMLFVCRYSFTYAGLFS